MTDMNTDSTEKSLSFGLIAIYALGIVLILLNLKNYLPL